MSNKLKKALKKVTPDIIYDAYLSKKNNRTVNIYKKLSTPIFTSTRRRFAKSKEMTAKDGSNALPFLQTRLTYRDFRTKGKNFSHERGEV